MYIYIYIQDIYIYIYVVLCTSILVPAVDNSPIFAPFAGAASGSASVRSSCMKKPVSLGNAKACCCACACIHMYARDVRREADTETESKKTFRRVHSTCRFFFWWKRADIPGELELLHHKQEGISKNTKDCSNRVLCHFDNSTVFDTPHYAHTRNAMARYPNLEIYYTYIIYTYIYVQYKYMYIYIYIYGMWSR